MSETIIRTTVVNVRDLGPQPWPPDVVYVGRHNARYRLPESIWANPYRMKREADRRDAIRAYWLHLAEHPELLARLPELRGKRLACWCRPAKSCHGDVLAELADGGIS